MNTISNRGDVLAVLPVDGSISFPLIIPTRVLTPHYDALVLTVCINSFDVHMVLVDPGSATDLFHLPAFNQMRAPIDHLHSASRVLSGFNRATTLSVGDITFFVKAGPVTQKVLFSMVEDLGPYNAILGRAWLHAMKVVPSIYHQTISYLTESRQVDLQGSQLAARQSSVRPTSEDRELLAVDPLETVPLDGSDRCIYISTLLSVEENVQLHQVI